MKILAAVLLLIATAAFGGDPWTDPNTLGPRDYECSRGCDVNTGECWKLLVVVQTDPVQTLYVGEPYPTEIAASCGARKLRREGVCLALDGANGNAPIGAVKFILDGPSAPDHPGVGDCYNE